ncbi:hypothetical protein [Clostridium sp. UBA4548]|uniref:hypothetical protein n=1 Tax=Clostridium sp. UBA4548 TaxID=1946361 RepID=UPI0025C4E5D3|nr:hypothetical protein [Clostridium sp. UBA4548]
MNEIDFYVSLIDEKEADGILKFLNKNIRSDSLEFKKTKIKTIFRGLEQVKKGKKVINDPFWACVSRHKLEMPLDLTEKEFINVLNEQKNEISDYVKFANLKLRFPNKVQEYLEAISKNIENKRYIFDFGLNFQNEGEIIEYVNKMAYFNNKEDLIALIDKFYTMGINGNLFEDNFKETENVMSWSLVDLFDHIRNLKSSDNFIIKYLYIKTHDDINKDILNAFIVDIFIELLLKFSENNLIISKNEINNYIEEINTFKEKLKKIELEKKEIDKEYKKVKKDSERDISNKEIELNKLKNKINTLEVDLKEIITQRQKINDLTTKNNELEVKLNEKDLEYVELKKRVESMEAYYEYAFGIDEPHENKIFGFIHSKDMDINITKTIFNEIEFISSDKWKEKVSNINKIYIQQQGINSKKREEIKKYCIENNIMNKVISIDNEKTLIETISMLKSNGGGI